MQKSENMDKKFLVFFVAAFFSALYSASAAHAANVGISSFGYHPEQFKQAIVYTASTSGSFSVYNADTNAVVFNGILSKPKDFTNSDTNCQGSQQCLAGDFSSLKANGNYYIKSGIDKSPVFKISSNIFSERIPLFLDVFEALRQQGSSYHANLHSVETPPFPAMADGSFIMTTYQLAFGGIRMASAYNRNPQLFSLNKYAINTQNAPDLAEHIKLYVEMMKTYQDKDGTFSVPNGYFYNFNCALDYDPSQPRYTTAKDACLQWNSATSSTNAVQALLLYAEAIPVIYQIDGQAAANALLDRAKKTQQYIKSNYPGIVGDDAAFYGAALFMLFDYTGETSYLQEAHSQRTKVNKEFDVEFTKGREFYWEEYARHKQAILNSGLQYEVDGIQPQQFFKDKIQNDWIGWSALHAISRNGERVYILNDNMDFQQTRFTLIEAVTAAKAQDLNSQDNVVQIVADSQLAWLSGMNQIQNGDFAGPLGSKSFIFGIGNFGKNQHVRLVNPNFFNEGKSFPNGMKYIAGWIAGSFDSFNDADKIFNYNDDYWSWQYTETTNEVVGTALELSAYLDAKYNNKAPLLRPKLTGIVSTCTFNGNTYSQGQQFPKGDGCNTCTCNPDSTVSCTQNTCGQQNTSITPPSNATQCFNTVNELPAECKNGAITLDSKSGCRTLECTGSSGFIKVMACGKTDSQGNFFEMYRQSSAGAMPNVCLASTCIDGFGYKKGQYFPICIGEAPSCTSSTEVCDGKDNDCNGQIDEYTACGIAAACGNGVRESNEQCDDGNLQNGDGCSSTCQTEQASPTNCYSKVNDIPASCTATITQDLKSGCRTLVCSSGANSIKVMACNKPDGSPLYFEMYRQSYAGAPPKICFGNTCMQNEGYKKSPNYPICFGTNNTASCTPTAETCNSKDDDCDGIIDDGNVCGTSCSPSAEICDSKDNDCDGVIDEDNVCGQKCYTSVTAIPSSCTSTITQDTKSSTCRTIACGTTPNLIKVMACDKPDSGTKQYFEMYRQSYSGMPPKVCFASVCIQTTGYVKSPNYPICAS